MSKPMEIYRPTHQVRVVTATSLFDGHDASINIMRRLLQQSGCEVIHLGHNRSATDVVNAALQEDVQAVALSSYQGGHIEYFKYIRDLLNKAGAGHIKMFGGGGGVIVSNEIEELGNYGVKIYSPEDGRKMGLNGIINDLVKSVDFLPIEYQKNIIDEMPHKSSPLNVARWLTMLELDSTAPQDLRANPFYIKNETQIQKMVRNIIDKAKTVNKVPVIGITGTGGAGKSSLIDELLRRFLFIFPEKSIAVFSVDPTKKRTGGALLGDRIRMNSLMDDRVFMRSLATRSSDSELSAAIKGTILLAKAADFDVVFVETSGIGQADSAIVDICDYSLYVMTSEYGAPSQLEKIEMLDSADFIVLNKFDRRGAQDALRDIRRQYIRNHQLDYLTPPEKLPVYPTVASHFNDPGVNILFDKLVEKIQLKDDKVEEKIKTFNLRPPTVGKSIIPAEKSGYLGEIVSTIKDYQNSVKKQMMVLQKHQALKTTLENLKDLKQIDSAVIKTIENQLNKEEQEILPETRQIFEQWEKTHQDYQKDEVIYKVRDQEKHIKMHNLSLSGTKIAKVTIPDYKDQSEIYKYLALENVPGQFPYTAGVFPFKRTDEDPKRQFAGEGTPERTNKRFHYLCRNDDAKRLSTAFDSVTLYGDDPDERPDIYGKIGEGGVSVCTLDDAKRLYAGFDLCHPNTSVSMTINGPAPIMLAFFLNTAIDQQVEKWKEKHKRTLDENEYERIKDATLKTVRGTVQSDILKEDQAQNTCIFSTDFALKLMGDMQEYLTKKKAINYYSVSISGYHMAEAGASPVTQLAYTIANGFTYVEYYLSRGMSIDDFAPNLSFFFSNGLEPEYSVLGRVARRIWSVAMKYRYKANPTSQKLKYHIQTSGRSLHAQDIDFNDIRTTMQALLAIFDNCNSLHTNSYDEAITTPTEESVRRAMAIQLIALKEFGIIKNENPLQGSFFFEKLTDIVEQMVLDEFEELNRRGGVLGAMESQYQRAKIQDESMFYEIRKSTGEYPIVGVNTFVNPARDKADFHDPEVQLARATAEEKMKQISNLREFQKRNADKTPIALQKLQQVALSGKNVFEELMETVKVASMGQITKALYEVGGKYRRAM